MFYKGIIFDLDNTLYNYEKCHKLALCKVINFININYEIKKHFDIQNEYNIISTKLKNELNNTASCHNKNIYFKHLMEIFGINLSNLDKLYELYWDTFLNNIKCFKGVKNFIKWNKKLGIKIGILTDYETEYQIKKLNKLELLDYIDIIVTSEEVGIEKPSCQMFLTILNKLNLNFDEVIMMGDNFDKDICGALNVNIFSYWFNTGNTGNTGNAGYENEKYTEFNCFEKLHNDFILINEELIKFKKLSKYSGERFDLVQAGGGNVSFKMSNWMFIKSSGINMANINETSGYVIINNKKLMNDISMENIKELVLYNVIGSQRGSIETFMHSILKKYTLHLHPIQVNRILVTKDAKNIINELFPESLVIDYLTPGIKICNEIKKKYDNQNIIFLINHGIIITSDCYEEVYKILKSVINKFENKQQIDYKKYKFTNTISEFINNNFNICNISYLCENNTIMEYFKTKNYLFNDLITFPDALIYCGIKNAFINTLYDIKEYYNKYNELPKIIIINDYIYINAISFIKCKEIEDVLLSNLMILDGDLEKNHLPIDEICFLNNWDAEKYRKLL